MYTFNTTNLANAFSSFPYSNEYREFVAQEALSFNLKDIRFKAKEIATTTMNKIRSAGEWDIPKMLSELISIIEAYYDWLIQLGANITVVSTIGEIIIDSLSSFNKLFTEWCTMIYKSKLGEPIINNKTKKFLEFIENEESRLSRFRKDMLSAIYTNDTHVLMTHLEQKRLTEVFFKAKNTFSMIRKKIDKGVEKDQFETNPKELHAIMIACNVYMQHITQLYETAQYRHEDGKLYDHAINFLQ